jgi:hypothetical protein
VLVLNFLRWVTAFGVSTKNSSLLYVDQVFEFQSFTYKLVGAIIHEGTGADCGNHHCFFFVWC